MNDRSPAAPSSGNARSMGLAAFALILLTASIAFPAWSLASEMRREQDLVIGETETLDDDLYVLASTFTLDGRAAGDVIVVARNIDISGSVGGSFNAIGGDVTISGTIERSVRILSGSVEITGSVTGDVLVFGGTVDIDPGAEVGGDVHVYGGTLDADGTVRGDIVGTIGRLDLTGTIGGDVSVDVERIELGNGAEIAGSLSYVAPSAVRIREGARISGPIDRDSIAPWGVGSDIRARFFSPLVRTVWMLMTGAIIIALAPRLASALNDTLRRPALVGIVGLVAIPLVPGIAVLLIASVVGIPLSMLILTTYLMALYLSQFVVGQRIGSLILPDRWNDGSRGYLLLSMTIGVLLLSVLRFVPIPFLGTLVNVLVAVLGLGAAVMLIRELRPDRSGRVA